MFNAQFKMIRGGIILLKNLCCFIMKYYYLEFWFRSSNIIEAPYNDILFLRRLENYKNYKSDKKVAELAMKKCINHK